MEVVKLRINDIIVNISVPKVRGIDERRERSKKIERYRIFLTKIFKNEN